jgi:hypothetical protein
MKSSKRLFAISSMLFAVLLSSDARASDAPNTYPASLTLAAALNARQQCVNTCRTRYRSCLSLKLIPSFECRGVYQDCTRYDCSASRG